MNLGPVACPPRDTGGPGHACLYPGNSELCDAPSPRWGPRHGSRSGAALTAAAPPQGLGGLSLDLAKARTEPVDGSIQHTPTSGLGTCVSAPVRPPPPGLRLSTVRGQGDFATRLGHAHSPPPAWVDTCIQVSGRGVLSWRPELSARCPHTVGLGWDCGWERRGRLERIKALVGRGGTPTDRSTACSPRSLRAGLRPTPARGGQGDAGWAAPT